MVSDASERAFKRHYAEIFRFLRRRTASADEAEELAQIVFTEAAARLPTLPATRDSVLGWLYTVARRRLIDHLRRQALQTGTLAQLDAVRLAAVEETEYGPRSSGSTCSCAWPQARHYAPASCRQVSHDSDRHQPRLGGAQAPARASRPAFVPGAEARRRRVVGHMAGRDHADRDILATALLDDAGHSLFLPRPGDLD
jgi:RNA polymerase sigma factor (sigma-70 family)